MLCVRQNGMKQFKQPYVTYHFWNIYSFSKLAARRKREKRN